MNKSTVMTYNEILEFATKTLVSFGLSESHALQVAEVMARCERDGCKSHGLHRLLMCIKSLQSDQVDQIYKPKLSKITNSLLKINAGNTLAPIAFNEAKTEFVQSVKSEGLAALVINNCFHFSALWPEIEDLVNEGIACMICLPSHSWVAPHGATGALLGTNPLAFGWPRMIGGKSFIFDFATSASARGEIELHARKETPLPLGWAIDSAGNDTTDAKTALLGAMKTFGGYKGSAISVMIELLSGPLIGDLLSYESLNKAPMEGCAPLHGELILGFAPEKFDTLGYSANYKRAEKFFSEMERLGSRLPSSRRLFARRKSLEYGIDVEPELLRIIHSMS